jgi:Protein of unknown function (DUF3306)
VIVAEIDTKSVETKESFTLSRWARLKNGREAEKNTQSLINENDVIAQNNWAITNEAVVSSNAATVSPEVDAAEDTLPSLDSVSLANDFTPFMQAKVPEALKRQALKALFKETHFNTMDGLDTYIDDYTKFEPISPEEMAGLSAWKSIMKPLEQVVTPGGYAVDVESEEGKAVLAAREALARRADANEAELANLDAAEPDVVVHALPHERYGKRVGDFTSAPETAVLSEDKSLDDVR